jgi:hypothetical protein
VGNIETDNVVEFGRDLWGEVIVNASEVGTEGGGLLDAAFHKGLGVVVEHAEAIGWQVTDGVERSVEDHVAIRGQHVWLGVIELSDLCDKVKVFEGSSTREFGAMQMGVPKEPEVVGKGMELRNN